MKLLHSLHKENDLAFGVSKNAERFFAYSKSTHQYNYFSLMKTASVSQIKQELIHKAPEELIDICLRLARYKKENKEWLTYLLFEANDPEGFINAIKKEIDESYAAIATTNLYYIKKSLRKILRSTQKQIRYTGSKVTEVELLLYFCKKLKDSKIPIHKSTALTNLYQGQLKKIRAAIATLHEDLQYDYLRAMEPLQDK